MISVPLIAVISSLIGIIMYMYGVILSRKLKPMIRREMKLENMEMDVPGFLSVLSDYVEQHNFSASIEYIISSPLIQENNIVREIRKYYKLYKMRKLKKVNTIKDVVRYATVEKYKKSVLLGLFYSVVDLVDTQGAEALPIVKSLEELSYNIVKFIIQLKRTMMGTVNTINYSVYLFMPAMNAISVILFQVIEHQLNNIVGILSFGDMSGFGGSSGSIMGLGTLTPVNLSPEFFSIVLMLQTMIISFMMVKIKYQILGKQSKYMLTVDRLKATGKNTLLYGVILYVMYSVFSGILS